MRDKERVRKMPPKHRDISPFLQMIRDFLLGRKYLTAHRFVDTMSARSVKNAGLAETADRLSANQYYTRDARCKVKPPVDLVEAKKLEEAAIAAAAAKAAEEAAKPPKEGAKSPPAGGAAAPDASKKDCKKSQSSTQMKPKNKTPSPGRLHNWD